ncbi:hypothetical protein [Moraxella marmotae]|uniref:hypothetical protein n=1 Tax=Moraxella marmotae TaxID=3344520 RepID=UPI0035F3A73C
MFYHDIDDLPTDVKPNHLIVISSRDFEKAKQTRETGQFLLESDKHFLVMPTQEESRQHSIIRPLYENNYLKENTILLLDKNPQNGNYYLPCEIVAERNIKMQMLHLPTLCQHLGAKRVSIVLNEKAEECRSMGIDIRTNVKGVNANTGTNYTNDQNSNNRTDLVTEFDGCDMDLAEAERLMHKGIFDGNDEIIAFYNSAKNQINRMRSQRLRCKTSQDISKQLNMFANANIPILQTIFNADTKAQMKKLQSLEIEYEVMF